jgi:nucleoid DNA-binding protein
MALASPLITDLDLDSRGEDTVRKGVRAFLNELRSSLVDGDVVALRGLGSWTPKYSAAREVVSNLDPQNPKKAICAARVSAKFKPAEGLTGDMTGSLLSLLSTED